MGVGEDSSLATHVETIVLYLFIYLFILCLSHVSHAPPSNARRASRGQVGQLCVSAHRPAVQEGSCGRPVRCAEGPGGSRENWRRRCWLSDNSPSPRPQRWKPRMSVARISYRAVLMT